MPLRLLPLLSLLLLSFYGCSQSEDDSSDIPIELKKEAEECEKYWINDIWNGRGTVVAGRVVADKPLGDLGISTRMSLNSDGWFVAPVHQNSTLCVHSHGYQPLVYKPQKTGTIDYAGELKLVKLPPGDLSTVQINVQFDEDEIEYAEVSLEVGRTPRLLSDDGGFGKSGITRLIEERMVTKSGIVTFSGLSPFEYLLSIESPGCKKQTIEFTPTTDEIIDLGSRTLEQAKVLKFHYLPDSPETLPKQSAQIQTEIITIDGVNTFDFSELQDDLGNSFYLRLNPTDKGAVIADYWFSPAWVYNLGKREAFGIEGIHSLDTIRNNESIKERDGHPLQAGYLYFFECPSHREFGTNCLFWMEELE